MEDQEKAQNQRFSELRDEIKRNTDHAHEVQQAQQEEYNAQAEEYRNNVSKNKTDTIRLLRKNHDEIKSYLREYYTPELEHRTMPHT
eukprot:3736118-Rhodomonas_salina.2